MKRNTFAFTGLATGNANRIRIGYRDAR